MTINIIIAIATYLIVDVYLLRRSVQNSLKKVTSVGLRQTVIIDEQGQMIAALDEENARLSQQVGELVIAQREHNLEDDKMHQALRS